eukprot:Phypoly_transcript_01761.p1 GENE.Phypoly_transcript_01761~~Phypoly_transcript_01761.p1  ORF type:complete len:997 (+),score=299.16 Phypoly_transcript_01761:86-3076(+)
MSELEKAVQKATASKAVQPKSKHVRSIVIEVWNENSARSFFTEISKRPVDTNDVVCFKVLTVIHKVLQGGPRQANVDAYYRLQWIESLRDHWLRQGYDKGYADLCNEYGLFLKDKILFHHRHTEFEGDFSLEKFRKFVNVEDLEMDKCMELVSHIMDLQDSVFKLERAIVEPRNVTDCKAGALIPLVMESYAIYTMLTFFLQKMVEKVESMDVIQYLIERFYSQYIILRDFYINAAAIRSVTTIIAVPNLPTDPPQFIIPANRKPRQPKSRKGGTPTMPRREPPPPQPAPVNPFLLENQWQPFAAAPPPQPAPVVINPFPTNFAPQFPPQPSAQWVTFDNNDSKPSDPFSELVSPLQTSTSTPSVNQTASPTLQTSSSQGNVPKATPSIATTTPAPTPQAAQPEKTRVITKIVTKTVTNTAELNKLKERIEELEKLNAELQAKNANLEKQNAELLDKNMALSAQLALRGVDAVKVGEQAQQIVTLEHELATERTKVLTLEEKARQLELQGKQIQAQSQRLEEQSLRISTLENQAAATHASLLAAQEQLDDALDAREKDRWNRAVSDLALGKESLEGFLSALDNPTNLGNPDATASLIVEDVTLVGSRANRLIDVARAGGQEGADPSLSQQELYGALTAVGNALRTLFTDAKGASRQVNDPAVSNRLLNGARHVGLNSLALLEALRMQGGQPQDEQENKILGDGLTVLQQSLTSLIQTAKDLELALRKQEEDAKRTLHEQEEIQLQLKRQEEQAGLDLDDLAERELRAAAKTIEDAAAALIAAKAARKPRAPNDNKPDVAEAILEAAMAIANATSTLVSSAAIAQRERAETGRARAAQGVPYKRDPTWAEGLISAAKAVAQATAALVGAANDAVHGKAGEEGLIAVSKAVAAATSQLVAAARAKSEPNSPTQEKLSSAARSVSHATSLLVAAARAASIQDEESEVIDYSKMSATGFKVKEMEQQMMVLRLEKDLQKARKGLAEMRKSEYAVTNPQQQ